MIDRNGSTDEFYRDLLGGREKLEAMYPEEVCAQAFNAAQILRAAAKRLSALSLQDLIATVFGAFQLPHDTEKQQHGEREYLTVPETADILRVSRSWLYKQEEHFPFLIRLGPGRRLVASRRLLYQYMEGRADGGSRRGS